MSFANELKDFVAGFKTGYSLREGTKKRQLAEAQKAGFNNYKDYTDAQALRDKGGSGGGYDPGQARGTMPNGGAGNVSASTGARANTGDPQADGVLDFIRQHEAGGNYNAVVGGGTMDLGNMTIAQVMDYQNQMRKQGKESTAIGGYQFVQNTLANAAKQAGLDPTTTKMTPQVQDKLAYTLMKGRGWDKFKSGEWDQARIMSSLAKEWAALPKDPGGKSQYEGIGSNKALTTWDKYASAFGAQRGDQTPIVTAQADEMPTQALPLDTSGTPTDTTAIDDTEEEDQAQGFAEGGTVQPAIPAGTMRSSTQAVAVNPRPAQANGWAPRQVGDPSPTPAPTPNAGPTASERFRAAIDARKTAEAAKAAQRGQVDTSRFGHQAYLEAQAAWQRDHPTGYQRTQTGTRSGFRGEEIPVYSNVPIQSPAFMSEAQWQAAQPGYAEWYQDQFGKAAPDVGSWTTGLMGTSRQKWLDDYFSSAYPTAQGAANGGVIRGYADGGLVEDDNQGMHSMFMGEEDPPPSPGVQAIEAGAGGAMAKIRELADAAKRRLFTRDQEYEKVKPAISKTPVGQDKEPKADKEPAGPPMPKKNEGPKSSGMPTEQPAIMGTSLGSDQAPPVEREPAGPPIPAPREPAGPPIPPERQSSMGAMLAGGGADGVPQQQEAIPVTQTPAQAAQPPMSRVPQPPQDPRQAIPAGPQPPARPEEIGGPPSDDTRMGQMLAGGGADGVPQPAPDLGMPGSGVPDQPEQQAIPMPPRRPNPGQDLGNDQPIGQINPAKQSKSRTEPPLKVGATKQAAQEKPAVAPGATRSAPGPLEGDNTQERPGSLVRGAALHPELQRVAIVKPDETKESTAAGLKYVQSQLTPKTPTRAVGPDPAAGSSMAAFATNQHGLSEAEYRQLAQQVDPEGKLPQAERILKVQQDLYDFYMAKGYPEKAAAASASVLMYGRRVSQLSGTMAQAALSAGDLVGAGNWMAKAYETLPDGKELRIDSKLATENGQPALHYQIVDLSTGQIASDDTATPDELLTMAKSMSSGAAWAKETLAVAQGLPRMYRGAARLGGGRASTTQASNEAKQAAVTKMNEAGAAFMKDPSDANRQAYLDAETAAQNIGVGAGMMRLNRQRYGIPLDKGTGSSTSRGSAAERQAAQFDKEAEQRQKELTDKANAEKDPVKKRGLLGDAAAVPLDAAYQKNALTVKRQLPGRQINDAAEGNVPEGMDANVVKGLAQQIAKGNNVDGQMAVQLAVAALSGQNISREGNQIRIGESAPIYVTGQMLRLFIKYRTKTPAPTG